MWQCTSYVSWLPLIIASGIFWKMTSHFVILGWTVNPGTICTPEQHRANSKSSRTPALYSHCHNLLI
jgi:hypothetical protein